MLLTTQWIIQVVKHVAFIHCIHHFVRTGFDLFLLVRSVVVVVALAEEKDHRMTNRQWKLSQVVRHPERKTRPMVLKW